MKIIECPRDAMQGLKEFIPTELKIEYLNQLLRVGFDTIDFGSFVSPKAIPQMADTKDVLTRLDLSQTDSKLLAIVANVRGAQDASEFDEIDYMGYPLSISETFQQRNTNRSISDGLNDLAEIAEIADDNNKLVVVYLSMGFGNPYGDPYDAGIVEEFASMVDNLGVSIISIADTVGSSTTESIQAIFTSIIPKFPHIEIGAHLHSSKDSAADKIQAAYNSGCRRMDGAILGFGGCPMAEDDLVGNLSTEEILSYLRVNEIPTGLNALEFDRALSIARKVFTSN